MHRFVKQKLKQVLPVPMQRCYRGLRARWKQRNLLHIVYIPTFKCNYHCPYCQFWKLANEFSERNAEHWLEWFNVLSPTLIDLTGGEPFLYKGLRRLLRGLPRKHKIVCSTNLSYAPEDYADLWQRFACVTASFHPHMVGISEFMVNLEKLKKFVEKVSCNIVAYPDQLATLPKYVGAIQKLEVPVHVDPYINENYEYSAVETRLVEKIRGDNQIYSSRKTGFDSNDVGVPKRCNAGTQHFLVIPNGDVFTCVSGYLQNPRQHCLGNVFNGDWCLQQKPVVCTVSCSYACDLDWARPKRLKN